MYNLYTKFVKILEICKQFSENLVNESGNVPRRGPVPQVFGFGSGGVQYKYRIIATYAYALFLFLNAFSKTSCEILFWHLIISC